MGLKGYKVKPKAVKFPIEDSTGKIHLLPPVGSLTYDDAELMASFNMAKTARERGEICQRFILSYCPDLAKDPEIGEADYLMIFDAYNKAYTNVGE